MNRKSPEDSCEVKDLKAFSMAHHTNLQSELSLFTFQHLLCSPETVGLLQSTLVLLPSLGNGLGAQLIRKTA